MFAFLNAILKLLNRILGMMFQREKQLERIENQLGRIETKLDRIADLLEASDIEFICHHLEIDQELEGQTTKGITKMKITDSQQIKLTVRPLTALGKPAVVEPGSVLWAFPPFVAATASPDGLSVTVVAVGAGNAPGGGSVSADADLGEGVVTLSSIFDVEVVPSQATSLVVEEGEPEEQVAAGPEPNA